VNRSLNENFDTKEKILKSAAKLFRINGYDATPISEIIRDAAVSKGSLYYYFPSKQMILYEIVIKSLKDVNPFYEKIFKSDLNPLDKMRKISRFHVLSMLENLDFVSVSLHEASRLEEPYRSRYIYLRDSHQHMYEEIIRTGIEAGIFGPMNIKLTTYAILSILNGPQRWYKSEGSFTPEEIADTYANMVCDYILRKPECN
jgi:AcrR family transcriptional regulator